MYISFQRVSFIFNENVYFFANSFFGAITLNTTTFSIMTLGITIKSDAHPNIIKNLVSLS
jgi:hypothetical protein